MTAPRQNTPLKTTPSEDIKPWPGRYALYLSGMALIAFGLSGILRNTHGWTHPTHWALLLIVFAIAHDLVLVPLVFAIAVPLSHLLPTPARTYVATGAIISAVLTAMAWPALNGSGRTPDNPTILPLNYPQGLRNSLIGLWLGLLVLAVLRAEVSRRRPQRSAPDSSMS